jgi:hypothetical protein
MSVSLSLLHAHFDGFNITIGIMYVCYILHKSLNDEVEDCICTTLLLLPGPEKQPPMEEHIAEYNLQQNGIGTVEQVS